MLANGKGRPARRPSRRKSVGLFGSRERIGVLQLVLVPEFTHSQAFSRLPILSLGQQLMANRYQVTCIIPHTVTDGRIQSIGGVEGGGWTMLEDPAINNLKFGSFTLWTYARGKVAEVVARQEHTGRWYLRTLSDGVLENNLLHLPRCPATYSQVN